jgi:hypothetical protein
VNTVLTLGVMVCIFSPCAVPCDSDDVKKYTVLCNNNQTVLFNYN